MRAIPPGVRRVPHGERDNRQQDRNTGNLMENDVAIQIATIALVAFACQWAAWRLKLPAILPLLLSGMALGPWLGLLDPGALLGDLLLPVVSLAVAVILFEGAMTLKVDEIRGLQKPTRRLVTWGALTTWGIIAGATVWLTELPFKLALLFGAMVTVTGPTVIVPLLRSVRPVASVARLLRWEGIVIDPVGALFAVLAYELIVVAGTAEGLIHSLWLFAGTILLGAVVGGIAAFLLAQLLRHHLVPEYLRSFLVLAAVVGQFVFSNALMHESGLVAVTVCGMVLTNWRGVRTTDILHFKENLSVILISGLFIVLAARIEMDALISLGYTSLLIVAVVQCLARPAAVLVSTVGSGLNWREKALLSWIGPRGIVAAAVSALFADRLTALGVQGAEKLVPLTFMVIIGTVALQSLTARPLARLLRVAEPAPRGFLIVGTNPVARAIGGALHKQGFPVVMADTSWDGASAARMAGLPVFFGHPVSQYADQSLDLVGIGHLLGLSQRRELNALATMRYRMEFGEKNVYALASSDDTDRKRAVHSAHRGAILFAADLTYAAFASALSRGAEVRATGLTEEYDYHTWRNAPDRTCWPLFAIDPTGRIHVYSTREQPRPGPGWQVVALVEEKPAKQNGEATT